MTRSNLLLLLLLRRYYSHRHAQDGRGEEASNDSCRTSATLATVSVERGEEVALVLRRQRVEGGARAVADKQCLLQRVEEESITLVRHHGWLVMEMYSQTCEDIVVLLLGLLLKSVNVDQHTEWKVGA